MVKYRVENFILRGRFSLSPKPHPYTPGGFSLSKNLVPTHRGLLAVSELPALTSCTGGFLLSLNYPPSLSSPGGFLLSLKSNTNCPMSNSNGKRPNTDMDTSVARKKQQPAAHNTLPDNVWNDLTTIAPSLARKAGNDFNRRSDLMPEFALVEVDTLTSECYFTFDKSTQTPSIRITTADPSTPKRGLQILGHQLTRDGLDMNICLAQIRGCHWTY